MRYVLAKLYTDRLLTAARLQQTAAETSLDLGRTRVILDLSSSGVEMPDGSMLPWRAVEAISHKDGNCFAIESGVAEAIHRFSARYNRSYTLRATVGAPTMLISGIPMHRIKGTTPDKDTERKIAAVPRLGAKVLDTATGLGYTAIAAAASGAEVTTVELDPAVIELCRLNPWSEDLFACPRIAQRIGNSSEVVAELPPDTFDTIIHDPPTFSLAGELYSGEFYRNAYRILRRGGSLFHYIGDLESRTVQSVVKGAIRRMQDAGFAKIVRHPDAFAVVAVKLGRR